MNINPYILIAAFILSFIVFYFAKRFNWQQNIAYHVVIAIIGISGCVFFTYRLTQQFNITYFVFNIILLIGIILKVMKILMIRKEKE